MKKFLTENLTIIFYALIIAVIIRSLLIQPFYIPSSSMEPNLLVGDRLFVTKFSYGYSRNSFPFSPPFFSNRILKKDPERGDVIVFKTRYQGDDLLPIKIICNIIKTCKTDYIKRLIGLPGDEILFVDGHLFINNIEVLRSKKNYETNEKINCGSNDCLVFEEKLPNGTIYITTYRDNNNTEAWSIYGQGTKIYKVPKDKYFFLGDNRDNSTDSRFLNGPSYIHKNDLVGKAQLIFFSSDYRNGKLFQFWKWFEIIRFDRFLKIIK